MADDNVDPKMLEQLAAAAGGAEAPAEMPADPEGEPMPEAPAEASPEKGVSAEEGELPLDQSQWQEMTIVEGLGTPDEHEDPFWRYGDYGVELDTDQKYEAYSIDSEDNPVMIQDGFESFEEAVGFLNESIKAKTLEGGETEAIPQDAPEAEIPDEPGEGPEKKENKKDEKEPPKGAEKKEDKKDEKKEDKKDSKPAKKSASSETPQEITTFRELMAGRWQAHNSGANQLARVPSTMGNIAKSQNRTMVTGGIRVSIGYDKDSVDHLEPRKGKVRGDDGSMRRIDPSIRSLMAPVHHNGGARVGAKSVDEIYGPAGHGGSARARTGAPCSDCAYASPGERSGSAESKLHAPGVDPLKAKDGGNGHSSLKTPDIDPLMTDDSRPGRSRIGAERVSSMY